MHHCFPIGLINTITGYSINYALALDGVADYLHWTPGGTGVSSTTWTFSCWFKQTRGSVANQSCFVSAGASNNATAISTYSSHAVFDNVLNVYAYHGSVDFEKQLVRHQSDAASWYHLVVQYDSTEGTDTNRIKLYINGVRYTDFETGTLGGTDSWPTLSEETDFGTTDTIKLGVNSTFGSPHAYFFLGEIAEVIMIDGAALDATSFGEEDDNGFWMPIEPSPANFPVTKITNAVPVMTGYTTPSGIVATDDDTNSPAWQAFNGVVTSPGNYWYGSGTTPNFITYEFTSNETVVEYGIWPQTGYAGSRYPTAWTLEGWTGSAWEVLDTRSGETSWTSSVSNDYTVASPDSYIKYKLDITAYTGLAIVQGIELRTAAIVNMGTNGFWLDFAVAPGTGNGAGTDVSGNDNHFTEVSLTAASQIVSTPTDNFATLDPLFQFGSTLSTTTYSNNNLTCVTPNGYAAISTMTLNSGKWYWENTWDAGTYAKYGWANNQALSAPGGGGGYVNNWWIDSGTRVYSETSYATTGTSYAIGDVIGFAVDFDNDAVWVSKNGTWMGGASLSEVEAGTTTNALWTGVLSGQTIRPIIVCDGGTNATSTFNAGQTDFNTAAPEGFLALSTANLPEPAIIDPSDHFSQQIVAKSGSTTDFTVPDWLTLYDWKCTIKNISGATEKWYVFDSFRGVTKYFSYDSNAVEATDANVFSFSGTTGTLGSTLTSGKSYLVEFHKAGLQSARNTNTTGSIAVTTSVNLTSLFGMCHHSAGTAANATIGHDLGVAPKYIEVNALAKSANATEAYHVALGAGYRLVMNTTAVGSADTTAWQGVEPTSTVFSVGVADATNANTGQIVFYYWDSVPGYSYFGDYTGNGNVNGPFVNLGFHPQSLLYKNHTTTTGYWNNWFSSMWPTNGGTTTVLERNTTNAAQSITRADSLSNGWKVRNITGDGNTNGTPALVCAWGGTPFKYSNGK
jgi:hypothetical protein